MSKKMDWFYRFGFGYPKTWIFTKTRDAPNMKAVSRICTITWHRLCFVRLRLKFRSKNVPILLKNSSSTSAKSYRFQVQAAVSRFSLCLLLPGFLSDLSFLFSTNPAFALISAWSDHYQLEKHSRTTV